MKSILILLVALLQWACVGGVNNTAPTAVYDFGLPAARLPADGKWARLALEVRSPPWFDSLNVDYRLAYDDPLKPREYAGSRWAGSPSTLLGQRLREQLGAVSANGSSAASCLLRVELQEFSQVFDSAQQSRGVVHGNALLIDGKRQLLAQMPVSIDRPAATLDARGGVSALVAASDELGQRLAIWLDGLEKTGRAPGCGNGN